MWAKNHCFKLIGPYAKWLLCFNILNKQWLNGAFWWTNQVAIVYLQRVKKKCNKETMRGQTKSIAAETCLFIYFANEFYCIISQMRERAVEWLCSVFYCDRANTFNFSTACWSHFFLFEIMTLYVFATNIYSCCIVKAPYTQTQKKNNKACLVFFSSSCCWFQHHHHHWHSLPIFLSVLNKRLFINIFALAISLSLHNIFFF